MTLHPELDLEIHAPTGSRAERRFLGWSEPFLPVAAAVLAAAYLENAELRMDRALVVVPGARAGRRLKELLLARAEAAGARLIPPRIVTIGRLPELLYAPELPLASDALSRRAWIGALRGLPRERMEAVAPLLPAADDLIAWTRLAGTVEALHREVSGGGLTFSQVADRCADGLLFSDSERWRVLSEAQSSYERLLDELGAADAGLARISALQRGQLATDTDVWLAGVVEMPRVVRSMLRSSNASGVAVRALVHAPDEEAEAFDELGCVLPDAWTRRAVPIPDRLLAVVGKPADQADEVVRSLADLRGSFAPDEIVVAVPDDEVIPFVEQRLAGAGVPARRATGARVTRTPAARLLTAIADFLGGRRYGDCAALARHPDLWRWVRQARRSGDTEVALSRAGAWITALDRYQSVRLPSRIGVGGMEGSGSAVRSVAAFCRMLDDKRFLGCLSGTRSIAGWMPEILSLLVQVYGEKPLDRAVPEQRELLDALSAIRDAAAELHRLPDAADEPCDAPTAIRLLLDAVGSKTIPPRADDAAVELLGWLEVHLDDAPVTVVTGLNEGMLPESINAHSFLPDALRTRLGLMDNAGRYARDAYQMTALVHSRRELKLVAGRRTVRGDPLRPSRLIFAVDGSALADRVRRFYEGDDAGPSSVKPVAPGVGSDGDRGTVPEPAFSLPPQPRLTAPEPIESLSVSRFGAVLTDPYRFALETVLRLRPLDDQAAELDGLGFGRLAHAVLERFGRDPETSGSTDAGMISRRLDEILDELVEIGFGGQPLPAVRLQVEQLRARLRHFAVWQAGWASDGWRIAGVECRTSEAGVPMIVDGEPFRITGRIDRLDYHAGSGRWAIFDYKTGDKGEPPDRTHRRGRGAERVWKDLQLPLYRHILLHVVDAEGNQPVTGTDPNAVMLGYILLPRDPAEAGPAFADWSADELAEADEAAREVVRFLRGGAFVWNAGETTASRDPHLAALLGLGHLEIAAVAEEEDENDG